MRGSFLCDVGRRVRGRQWPAVAQAFRPADERGAALKGCAARLATVCLAVLVMTSSAITAAATADLRLIEAVKNRDVESVRALLQERPARIDVNAAQGDGATALHWAAHRDDLAIADLLIRAGARANVANDLGATPLHLACTNRSAAMVERLLAAGADTRARSLTYAQTVVGEQTQRAGREELNYTVLRGGATPLLFAARAGDEQSATLLLKAGADPNDSQPDGVTALVLAVHSANGGVAARLLEHGADPNALSSGYTALHAAILRSDLNLVKALLGRGANPNLRMTKGTPMRRDTTDWNLPATLIGSTPYLLAAKFLEPDIMRL